MELEQKKMDKRKLERALAEREEEKLKHLEKCNSLVEEAQMLSRKLEKVRKIRNYYITFY